MILILRSPPPFFCPVSALQLSLTYRLVCRHYTQSKCCGNLPRSCSLYHFSSDLSTVAVCAQHSTLGGSIVPSMLRLHWGILRPRIRGIWGSTGPMLGGDRHAPGKTSGSSPIRSSPGRPRLVGIATHSPLVWLRKGPTSAKFRSCSATRLRQGYGAAGNSIETTMIYTHVVRKLKTPASSPLDTLDGAEPEQDGESGNIPFGDQP